ncbi:5-methylcytosine-specific restriction enzyme A [Cytobacillus horneckiae]
MNYLNNNQRYDKYKRNKKARSFYKSAAWKKCRKLVLERDNHLCQSCMKNNKITPADMVHHIIELLDDWDKALEMDNLESLCNSCHNKEHPDRGIRRTKPKKNSKIKIVKAKANEEII